LSRKNVYGPKYLLNATDISADRTSDEMEIDFLDNFSIILNWTGTSPVGVLYVQVSNSKKEDATPVWENLTFDNGNVAISGNTGSHLININQAPFKKMRLFYDRTSGSGNLTAQVFGKML
jgi:hypothetical protein